MTIITIEFNEVDAHRLLWLVQREAGQGRIWDKYWESIANHIRANITDDLGLQPQIFYQEEVIANGKEKEAGRLGYIATG